MPHELRNLAPAYAYLERSQEFSLMLQRSLRLGLQPGFAAIVDDPDEVKALMLVRRTDWKQPGPKTTRIQMDALDPRSAVHLLAWLPPEGHLEVYSYRPWVHDLICSMMKTQRVSHRVHSLARRRQFRPGANQALAVELNGDPGLRRQVKEIPGLGTADRLFGIVSEGEVVACAGLSRSDTDYVSVAGVYARDPDGLTRYGSAVLSAATQAGLDTGKVVSYCLPVEDVTRLHLVAELGYTPVCREWMVEGYAQG